MPIDKNAKIFLAGHKGLVGSAILRQLEKQGYSNLVLRTHAELDLCDQQAVDKLFESERPEYVFLAAAKVGGIRANDTFPADFVRINLQIQTNVMDAAFRYEAAKLLFLGSSCIYPKLCPQPMKEEHLLTGALEPTNDAYAIAKIAGIITCKSYNRQYGTNFVAAMPTNLYGPRDNFDLETSHVLPAIIRRLHEAKLLDSDSVTLWGTGSPYREFLYIEDMAEAMVFLMNNFDADPQNPEQVFVNVGVGRDLTIKELAKKIQKVVGFQGNILWDDRMPDGTPRKLLDVSRLSHMGWKAGTSLEDGLRKTYDWYLSQF